MAITNTQAMITISDTTADVVITIEETINVDFAEWHPNTEDSTSVLTITDSFSNVLWKVVAETSNLPIHYSTTILKQELKKLSVRELNVNMSDGILYIFRL